jgi:hypothetical protein
VHVALYVDEGDVELGGATIDGEDAINRKHL